MKNSIATLAAATVLLLSVEMPAWAGSSDDVRTVTVKVNNVLSVTDETGNFILTFEDYVKDTRSTGQTVGYIVKANNMPNAALAGALSAKISTALIGGIDFQASETSTSFVNDGTSGNAVLNPISTSGFITIGTTAVALADKPASTGNQGKVLHGRFFVNWSCLAKRDLSSSDGGTVTLTVTLKDA